MVNGYRFHTRDYGQYKATVNSRVCCRGNLYDDNELDYYRFTEEIMELVYVDQGNNVFILCCYWFDPVSGIRYDDQYKLIDIYQA
ncbi:hypothetical protein CDL12_27738 [Handroanthus impetiginosus]|uniref:DUF4216 domain-containing protein n=1 Tax=Handroanthus impetiginosus TaxID=429701 RepID=A0A2G9G372_9LAMI|nr:hypothetical protein CDL12_27738 [Handroanthus impetiginosus]